MAVYRALKAEHNSKHGGELGEKMFAKEGFLSHLDQPSTGDWKSNASWQRAQKRKVPHSQCKCVKLSLTMTSRVDTFPRPREPPRIPNRPHRRLPREAAESLHEAGVAASAAVGSRPARAPTPCRSHAFRPSAGTTITIGEFNWAALVRRFGVLSCCWLVEVGSCGGQEAPGPQGTASKRMCFLSDHSQVMAT